ncbi:hypothetical protein [Streptomyces sp. A3M-1-3]|uniref:hypothetical protein n=1 Tax=Streptomyces sp. A3M-1-3 TaxID=2962044 RepID=UPI0035ABE366
MDQGVSSREACRIVGINRRTGKRWRKGTNPTRKRPAQPAHRVRAERVVSSSVGGDGELVVPSHLAALVPGQ